MCEGPLPLIAQLACWVSLGRRTVVRRRRLENPRQGRCAKILVPAVPAPAAPAPAAAAPAAPQQLPAVKILEESPAAQEPADTQGALRKPDGPGDEPAGPAPGAVAGGEDVSAGFFSSLASPEALVMVLWLGM